MRLCLCIQDPDVKTTDGGMVTAVRVPANLTHLEVEAALRDAFEWQTFVCESSMF
jgi:hypothetical protein